MLSLIDQGERVIFGGEGNGGLIFPNHQFCRDGGMSAAMMVFILASTGKKLSELVKQLPKRHIIKDKISTPHGEKILEALSVFYSQNPIDRTDGLKVYKDTSWALIRSSGTEPILRIIIDSEKPETGIAFHEELKHQIRKIIQ